MRFIEFFDHLSRIITVRLLLQKIYFKGIPYVSAVAKPGLSYHINPESLTADSHQIGAVPLPNRGRRALQLSNHLPIL